MELISYMLVHVFIFRYRGKVLLFWAQFSNKGIRMLYIEWGCKMKAQQHYYESIMYMIMLLHVAFHIYI